MFSIYLRHEIPRFPRLRLHPAAHIPSVGEQRTRSGDRVDKLSAGRSTYLNHIGKGYVWALGRMGTFWEAAGPM